MHTPTIAPCDPDEAGGGMRPYHVGLVALLLLITVGNYLDRNILAVVQEPLKRELTLSDLQLGLLGGPAFALFYSLAGIPLARFSERWHRGRLLAAAATCWSAMTALCAAATGFAGLALCRIGVGAAEGGCVPITHALVSDTFTRRSRGFALSVISAGPSIAGILTPLIGGVVAQHYGWRAAFLAVGLPGFVLAAVTWWFVRDRRAQVESAERPGFRRDIGWLLRNRTFRLIFLGGAFTGMAHNSVLLFEMSFLIRSQALTLVEAGGVRSAASVVGLFGILAGGLAADRFADARGRSYVLVPAVAGFATASCYAVAFSSASGAALVALLLAGSFFYNIKNGPLYAAVQNAVQPHMRATGAAVFMLGATVLGGMVGAPLTGAISDATAARLFPADLGRYADLCRGGHAAEGAVQALVAACEASSAQGLRVGLAVASLLFVAGAICLAWSARAMTDTAPPED